MFYIVLADGFEEIEALAFVDIIRRGDIEIKTASLNDDNISTGAHGISVVCDINIEDIVYDSIDAFILPGGMPGTINLDNSLMVDDILSFCFKNDKYIGAICAAPLVLGRRNLLKGKKATCFPGFEDELKGAFVADEKVISDGKIITAKGAGCAHEFAFEFIKKFKSKETADKIKSSMQY